jgi:hypothetical protein
MIHGFTLDVVVKHVENDGSTSTTFETKPKAIELA